MRCLRVARCRRDVLASTLSTDSFNKAPVTGFVCRSARSDLWRLKKSFTFFDIVFQESRAASDVQRPQALLTLLGVLGLHISTVLQGIQGEKREKVL
jgi:hypothetical protein